MLTLHHHRSHSICIVSRQIQITVLPASQVCSLFSIARRRTPVPRNDPLLLVLEVLVDARHPRVDFVCQDAFSTLVDVLGPLVHFLRHGLDTSDAILGAVPDAVRDPFDRELDAARDIAEHLVRSQDHHHVREPVHEQAQLCPRPFGPDVPDRLAVRAAEVDGGKGARDGVEARRVD